MGIAVLQISGTPHKQGEGKHAVTNQHKQQQNLPQRGNIRLYVPMNDLLQTGLQTGF